MKKLLRNTGIAMIVGAVLIFILACAIQEMTKPIKVTTGVVTNGQYRQLGKSGYMGGSAKAQEDMRWLKGTAGIIGVSGVGFLIGALGTKEEKEPEY